MHGAWWLRMRCNLLEARVSEHEIPCHSFFPSSSESVIPARTTLSSSSPCLSSAASKCVPCTSCSRSYVASSMGPRSSPPLATLSKHSTLHHSRATPWTPALSLSVQFRLGSLSSTHAAGACLRTLCTFLCALCHMSPCDRGPPL